MWGKSFQMEVSLYFQTVLVSFRSDIIARLYMNCRQTQSSNAAPSKRKTFPKNHAEERLLMHAPFTLIVQGY
jgi:hypothetical protein